MSDALRDQLALLPAYLTAHLQLSLVALLLGAAVSVPAGLWVSRRPTAERIALGIASVLQTIPSLALLAIMVPALAALGRATQTSFGFAVPSIGFLPALIGLTLYSVLPILRNTVTGIAGVDPAVVEAARAVGMTDRQRLRRVELPLALPVIVAGVRTATVWVVGLATLSTPVGAPSLGNYIFSGLQTRNLAAVLVGCVAAAALALVLDALVHALERGVRVHRRGLVVGASLALAALYLHTAVTLAAGALGHARRPIAIGSKTFTEQYILSAILAGRIATATGTPARVVPSLGSTVAFDALRDGTLDCYVDYSGTIWATIMRRTDVPADRGAVLAEVTRYLREHDAITVVGALGFENAYALVMRDDRAGTDGIRRISDLAARAPDLTIAGDYEFFSRPEWSALTRAYALRFGAQRSMDPSLMYEAVAAGDVDVASAFSTDGRIAAFALRALEDDRGAIPPYDAIVLASARLVRDEPRVLDALAGLNSTIDAATMRRMNAAVDQEGRSPNEVARAFLAGAP
ncbi:MAG: ABC transporter permease/substrate-binding protein [Deltaproteobacteria bacterium]|nr:ABC transporter permease/substrate-binding protein [Deltaproteobacteria bacterium]